MRDTVETTPPTTNWKDFEPAAISFTVTGDAIGAFDSKGNMYSLGGWLVNGLKVDFRLAAGGLMYSGKILITNVNITAAHKDLVKYTFTAIGCGQLATNTASQSYSVYLANPVGKRLAGCPNPYPVGLLWYDNTFIGLANDAEDVIEQFNAYIENNGQYILTGTSGGCDFTMQIPWDSDDRPQFIPAVPGNAFGIGTAVPGQVIGIDNSGNVIIGP
ncbi:hypothetical protein [Chitinophaga parva]|uniref:hypothetical protein n=1 Tax=Chitinophaga parva TaxID=2169414 RepID=UPI0010575138|nr:hypothetical protein [Chitinophaga parva]